MIKTVSMLKQELKEYSDITSRISILVDKGELTLIIRGYYETDKTTPGHYLASLIYGPSYLSFEFALSYHGLIPEAVYIIHQLPITNVEGNSMKHHLVYIHIVMFPETCFILLLLYIMRMDTVLS